MDESPLPSPAEALARRTVSSDLASHAVLDYLAQATRRSLIGVLNYFMVRERSREEMLEALRRDVAGARRRRGARRKTYHPENQ